MKVIVTGGAGFIGSHIVEGLLFAGAEVVVIDNLVTGKLENIPAGVTVYQEDLRNNLDDIFRAERPDYVIHQAAQVSVSTSMKQPFYDGEENILATINLLQMCVRYQTKKLIFASTAAVYGDPIYLSVDERHSRQPLSFYGLSKLHAEAYIQLFSRLYGVNYTILRYANVYGPRQNVEGEAGVVAIFIDKIFNGHSPIIYGDGNQTRDFVFVKDVARANLAAIEKGDNEIINVSTNKETSILEIIHIFSSIFHNKITPEFTHPKKGDIKDSYLSNQKARSLLKWEPDYPFSHGLAETVAHFKLSKGKAVRQ